MRLGWLIQFRFVTKNITSRLSPNWPYLPRHKGPPENHRKRIGRRFPTRIYALCVYYIRGICRQTSLRKRKNQEVGPHEGHLSMYYPIPTESLFPGFFWISKQQIVSQKQEWVSSIFLLNYYFLQGRRTILHASKRRGNPSLVLSPPDKSSGFLQWWREMFVFVSVLPSR